MTKADKGNVGVEEDLDLDDNIMYVREKILKDITSKVKGSKTISKEDVESLFEVDDVPDEEIFLPVDMKDSGNPVHDVEELLEKVGPKKAAEIFVKARELFESNPDKKDAAERPKSMTAVEWREVLDCEEDSLDGFEGDEEELADFLDELGEEELGGFDEDEGEEEEVVEPANKASVSSFGTLQIANDLGISAAKDA